MFCKRCGAQIGEQEKWCGSCGAFIDRGEGQRDAENADSHGAKKKHRTVGIAACAIVGVLIIVGVIAILNKSEKPEVVVEKYLNASMAFDYDTINKYSAFDMGTVMEWELANYSTSEDEIREQLLDEYGMTDIKKIFQGPLKEKAYESLKSQYGADYIISVNIADTTELSKSEMNDQLDAYRDILDSEDVPASNLIDIDKIKGMCRVRGKLSIEGSKDEDSDAFELYCVKMGGKWKVFADPDSIY